MKEEALKLADELDALHQYVPSEAPAMIRRLVEELDRLDYDLKSLANRYKALDRTKPLSDDEIKEIYEKCWEGILTIDEINNSEVRFARAIEERHGIK